MFLRLLWESFVRQRRRKLLAGLAILLGTTAVTAMLGLATTIGDRIHRELAVYGANIIVYPKANALEVKVGNQTLQPATGGATLHESDLAKLQGIFWHNNITGVSPELTATIPITQDRVDPNSTDTNIGFLPPIKTNVVFRGLWFDHTFGHMQTGAPQLHPWWKLKGSWPKGPTDVVIGAKLAKKLNLDVGSDFGYPIPKASPGQKPRGIWMQGLVAGIVTTGSPEDDMVLLPLEHLQYATDLPDAVSRVEVSARTKPEDAFARRDPDTLPAKMRDVWYCRPYANSIAYQIREAIPGAQAEQVRQVEQSEGTILERISGLMWLVAAAALLAAAVAVSAAMATAVLERRTEIGLMRSLGASRGRIAFLFYAEAGLLAVIAGIAGYLVGSLLAAGLTARIFGEPAGVTLRFAMGHAFNPVLLPVVLGVALLVAIAGSTASIHGALRMDPSAVLRADA